MEARTLCSLEPFRAVPEASCRALAEIGQRRTVEAGDAVLDEGELSGSFFIVVSGQVKMCRLTPAGKNLILALFGPEEIFGIANALGGDRCRSSMVAVTDSELIEVRRRDLYDLFERRPRVVGDLLPILTRHLMECRNCLVEVTCAKVETRFAQLFLQLGAKLGEPVDGGRGVFIPLALSRQELADLTGTAIETAIRVMSRWGKEGIVDTTDDGFAVRDETYLRKLVLV